MKKILTIILIFIVAIIIILFINTDTTDSPDINNSTKENNSTNKIDMETYTSSIESSYNLRIQHPQEAEVSNVQQNIYEIKYIGPNNKQGTEITDGYYISLQVYSQSPENYISNNLSNEMLVDANIGNQTVKSYTDESQLGNMATHYIIPTDNEFTIDAGVTISGYSQSEYVNIVRNILDKTMIITKERAQIEDLIIVNEPKPLSNVSSPITVKGEARGYWFFEANAPVIVTNWDGEIIGEGFIETTDSWTTEDFVQFEGNINYSLSENTIYDRGTVIIQKANPSGLPKNDRAVEIGIKFNR